MIAKVLGLCSVLPFLLAGCLHAQTYETVPFVRALAFPTELSDHRVEIAGYLRVGQETTALYLDRQAYDFYLHENAIWLGNGEFRPGLKKFEGRLIRVRGKFRLFRGHLGAYAATLAVEEDPVLLDGVP